jgi:hypothetical protein
MYPAGRPNSPLVMGQQQQQQQQRQQQVQQQVQAPLHALKQHC